MNLVQSKAARLVGLLVERAQFSGALAQWRLNLAHRTLGHATSSALAAQIRREGFNQPYNHFCTEEGWYDRKDGSFNANIKIAGKTVADRAYPDPEDFFSDVQIFKNCPRPVSFKRLVAELGLPRVEAEIDSFLSDPQNQKMHFTDMTDPDNFNIVVAGPIPATAIRR